MPRRKRRTGSLGGASRALRLGPLRLRPVQIAAALVLLAVAGLTSIFLRPAEGQVVDVIDGDTIEVYVGGGYERVRLLGVDTPEVRHPAKGEEPFGREASEFTRRALLGRQIMLQADPEADDCDRYGRLLRVVLLPDGADFNASLVREGLARATREFAFSRKGEYVALEEEARRAGKGIWVKAD